MLAYFKLMFLMRGMAFTALAHLHKADVHGRQFALDEIIFHEGSIFDGTLTGSFNTFGIEIGIPRQLHLKALLVEGKTIIEETFENRERSC